MEIKGAGLKQKVGVQKKTGHTVFKSGFPEKLRKEVMKKEVQKVMKQGVWDLSNTKYKFDKWSIIFEWIEQANCTNLNLKKGYNQEILKQISSPRFPSLIVLDLQANKIANIQALAFLNCPLLMVLNLRHNFILDLKSMNKTEWNSLVELDLSRNLISKMNLSRVKFGQGRIRMTLEAKETGQNFMQDLGVMFKLQIMAFSQFNNFSNSFLTPQYNRIYQKHIPKMVKKRWPSNSIVYFWDILIY